MAHVKDAYTFLHDANARNDVRMLTLRAKFGVEGYGVYFMLLEILRESTDYRIPSALLEGISINLCVSHDQFKEIVDTAIEVGLFAEENQYFYSPAMLRRMSVYDAKRDALKANANRRWQTKNANAMQLHSNCNAIATTTFSNCNAIEEQEQEHIKSISKSKSRSQKRARAEAFKEPDRSGFPRRKLEEFNLLWMSDSEIQACFRALAAGGLRQEFFPAAFDAVDRWFGNPETGGPAAYAKSAEHAARVKELGLSAALKKQSEHDNAKAAESRVNKARLNERPSTGPLAPTRSEIKLQRLYGDDTRHQRFPSNQDVALSRNGGGPVHGSSLAGGAEGLSGQANSRGLFLAQQKQSKQVRPEPIADAPRDCSSEGSQASSQVHGITQPERSASDQAAAAPADARRAPEAPAFVRREQAARISRTPER